MVVGVATKLEKAINMVSDILIARRIPFVFSTGYGRQGLAPAYQCYPVIQKPFCESDLSEALLGALKPH